MKELEPERQRLNALDYMDYEAVMRAKIGFLKRIFPLQKTETFRDQAYQDFFAENEHWLAPYAALVRYHFSGLTHDGSFRRQ